MPITKVTKPDALLFRFDPNSPTPVIRGAAYYERTTYVEDGVEIPGSSVEGNAQAVSIAAGVPGLDLTVVLGHLSAGLSATVDELTAAVAGRDAKLAAATADAEAKDATAQDLLDQLDAAKAEAARLRIVVDAFAAESAPAPIAA